MRWRLADFVVYTIAYLKKCLHDALDGVKWPWHQLRSTSHKHNQR
jgi:hypothetical protein